MVLLPQTNESQPTVTSKTFSDAIIAHADYYDNSLKFPGKWPINMIQMPVIFSILDMHDKDDLYSILLHEIKFEKKFPVNTH